MHENHEYSGDRHHAVHQVDPARRISAGEALKHPFFDEHEGGSANGA
jgi:hypothetical protein